MSQEQLDAIKEQLMSEDNADVKQKVFGAYLEEPERGANMIIAFAKDKGLKLESTAIEVVDYIDNLGDDDIDIEMTPEMLTSISGGKSGQGIGAHLANQGVQGAMDSGVF